MRRAIGVPLPSDEGLYVEVKLKLDDVSIGLGNKGILLKISDNQGKHVGDLRIGKATVEWMKGRTRDGNGIKIKLEDLIKCIEGL
ncbi:hypothetical protein [Micromonospora sp. WMMD712]|uniref:hypothetical protein n=1 Tax=Micromonospora sp. WMMD712 TaxID=3016096 RepID=UPI00249B81AB|nr:hypothetical protein [Micromonospora sp. WMMD712]WFE58887.1 hypothetical protein O7633_19455 [Micromonospora sp. WMMD712]